MQGGEGVPLEGISTSLFAMNRLALEWLNDTKKGFELSLGPEIGMLLNTPRLTARLISSLPTTSNCKRTGLIGGSEGKGEGLMLFLMFLDHATMA